MVCTETVREGIMSDRILVVLLSKSTIPAIVLDTSPRVKSILSSSSIIVERSINDERSSSELLGQSPSNRSISLMSLLNK
jgi:hypothetical protein